MVTDEPNVKIPLLSFLGFVFFLFFFLFFCECGERVDYGVIMPQAHG